MLKKHKKLRLKAIVDIDLMIHDVKAFICSVF